MDGKTPFFNLSTTIDTTNQSAFTHAHSKVYVFTPAGSGTKLTLVVLMVALGVVGFIGNAFILYFVSKNRSTSMSPLLRNVNLYIKSSSLSDTLATSISLPLISIQISFDVFQHGWPCKVVRYIGLLFPSITMNNLIVISLERFLATRSVPRTLSVSHVGKLVYGSWAVGFIVVCVPTATMKGIRYDVNATHYTVVCKYDISSLPPRVMCISFTLLQHLIPSIILICINIIVAKRVRKICNGRINVLQDNVIRARQRAAKIRSTYLLILITLAFIFPYSSLLHYGSYVTLTTPQVDFLTDYKTRCIGGLLFYSSSAINFVIYLIQMKDFRAFLKNLFRRKRRDVNPNPGGAGIQLKELKYVISK